MRNSNGFSLIETLIALAVIGIAMAAALRSTRFSVDTVAELKHRSAAVWVAGNVTNQLLATRQFPEPGATDGKMKQGQQEYLWRQEVSITPNYSFRRAEIKVFLPGNPDHAIAKQVSYVARKQN